MLHLFIISYSLKTVSVSFKTLKLVQLSTMSERKGLAVMVAITQEIEEKKRSLIQYYENPQVTAEAWKAKGGKVVGYLCSYVPEEILLAAGILPVRILGHLDDISVASSYFQPFVCRLIRSTLEKGLTKNLAYLNGLIISYTCDGMRMLYDTWVANVNTEFNYLLDLPSSLDRMPNLRYFQRIIKDFIASVEAYTGRAIKEEDLRSAISIYNRYRRLAKEFYYLHFSQDLPLSSADFLKINLAAFVAPKDKFTDELEAYLGLFKAWRNSGAASQRPKMTPVHISGSVVVDPVFFELVEKVGGYVISDDLCTGTRYFWDEVEEEGDPIQALAHRYLSRVTCPSKYPAENRSSFLLDRIRESGARGVIILGEKFCDPHLFEIPSVRKRIEALGVSSLCLETELVATGREQLVTRLEAFVDILKRKEGIK